MSADHIDSVDVNSEWDYGIVGKLTTTPAIVFETAGSLLGGIGAGSATKTIVLGIAVTAVGLVLVLALCLVRRHRRTWMRTDEILHSIFHFGRDQINEIACCCDLGQKKLKFQALNTEIVNSVAAYYKARLHDDTITCCLRLATSDPVDGDSYITVARSVGMEANRASKSVPIRADSGIAKAFLDRKQQGVFLFNDFTKAEANGWWEHMANDRCHDVNTALIAPINGWDGNKKAMFGMLFACSKNKVFQPAHALPLKAIVDYLGVLFQTQYVGSLNEQKFEPELKTTEGNQ